jgi:hypothetical protein
VSEAWRDDYFFFIMRFITKIPNTHYLV